MTKDTYSQTQTHTEREGESHIELLHKHEKKIKTLNELIDNTSTKHSNGMYMSFLQCFCKTEEKKPRSENAYIRFDGSCW